MRARARENVCLCACVAGRRVLSSVCSVSTHMYTHACLQTHMHARTSTHTCMHQHVPTCAHHQQASTQITFLQHGHVAQTYMRHTHRTTYMRHIQTAASRFSSACHLVQIWGWGLGFRLPEDALPEPSREESTRSCLYMSHICCAMCVSHICCASR